MNYMGGPDKVCEPICICVRVLYKYRYNTLDMWRANGSGNKCQWRGM